MKNISNALCTMALLFSTLTAYAAGGGSSVGPANPAAENCLTLGGSVEATTTPAGEGANCAIEEWNLYRAMDAKNLLKEHHYQPGGMPNPAAVNCLDINGAFRIVETPEGEAGYCVVEEWALYHVFNDSNR